MSSSFNLTEILFAAVLFLAAMMAWMKPVLKPRLKGGHPGEAGQTRARRRRRAFAIVRIVQVSLYFLAGACLTLAFTYPTYPGRPGREMYYIAWSSRENVVATAQFLALGAVFLTIISIPLKRRWSAELQGWIE